MEYQFKLFHFHRFRYNRNSVEVGLKFNRIPRMTNLDIHSNMQVFTVITSNRVFVPVLKCENLISKNDKTKTKKYCDERHDNGWNAVRIGKLNVEAPLFTDVEVSRSDKRFAKSSNSLVSSGRRKVQLIWNKITWNINWCAIGCVRLVAVVSPMDRPRLQHGTEHRHSLVFTVTTHNGNSFLCAYTGAHSNESRKLFTVVNVCPNVISFALCIYLFFFLLPVRLVLPSLPSSSFQLWTSHTPTFIKFNTQKKRWENFRTVFIIVKILRQKWEIFPWAVAMCASTEYTKRCGSEMWNETEAKESSIRNAIPTECGTKKPKRNTMKID